jgi:hypothetical protein
MRGNYKVRVRVPIYASAVIDFTVYGEESEAAAMAEAQAMVGPGDVREWFNTKWEPRNTLSMLVEIIEFEATEEDTTKEGKE